MGQAQQKRRPVLIVEDEAELRGLAAALLEDSDFDTIECERPGRQLAGPASAHTRISEDLR